MSGSIAVTVLDLRSREPVQGVSLELSGGGVNDSVQSDNKGAATFGDLAAGSYEFTAKKNGYQDEVYGPLVVLDDVATEISIALSPKYE